MKSGVFLLRLQTISHNLKSIPLSMTFHSSAALHKKVRKPQKYISFARVVSDYELDRIAKGLSRTGTEYGPLTDKPDWSYADGRPGIPAIGQMRRKAEQHHIASQVFGIHQEMEGIKKHTDHITTHTGVTTKKTKSTS